MKKGILIIVAILLMILAVFPVVDYFFTKNLVYSKGEITNAQDYIGIKEHISEDINFNHNNATTFFIYFTNTYRSNSAVSITYEALYRLMRLQDDNTSLTIWEPDSMEMIDYICYVVDLFLVWFMLFAILQVPAFTIRLMGLDKDKGGKRL